MFAFAERAHMYNQELETFGVAMLTSAKLKESCASRLEPDWKRG